MPWNRGGRSGPCGPPCDRVKLVMFAKTIIAKAPLRFWQQRHVYRTRPRTRTPLSSRYRRIGFEGKDETTSNDLVVLIVMIVLLVGGGLLLNFQIRRTERKDKLEQAANENAVKSTGAATKQKNAA